MVATRPSIAELALNAAPVVQQVTNATTRSAKKATPGSWSSMSRPSMYPARSHSMETLPRSSALIVRPDEPTLPCTFVSSNPRKVTLSNYLSTARIFMPKALYSLVGSSLELIKSRSKAVIPTLKSLTPTNM